MIMYDNSDVSQFFAIILQKGIDRIKKKWYNRPVEQKYAPLAQLVEQLTLNQWVPGSNP